jgi:hypothetical protein
MEVTMKLNDVAMNREAFDLAEQAILAKPRETLLRLLGPRTPGLLVWHFGAVATLKPLNESGAERT